MSGSPQDLRGLAIAIYATLVALLAWVTWIILTTARRRQAGDPRRVRSRPRPRQ